MIGEKADNLIFELERYAEISQSNNPNPKRIATRKTLRDYIAELEAENAKLKSQLAKNKELLTHVKNKLLTVSELDADTIRRKTERAEKAEAYINKLEANIPANNLALAKANLRTATLEAENAALKDRIAAYETGFDPKANKPKEISDLEDEIVVFKDKMGRPYIGVFDTVINKWCCIAETKSIFSTDAIERWFPLPGRRGE